MIIAITGFRRCGKDFLASKLEEFFSQNKKSIKKYAFAYPLKKYVSELTGLTIEEIEKLKELKEKKFTIIKKNYNMRELLINFANELRNLTSKDIWAQAIISRISEDSKNIDIKLITDLRFLDEYKLLAKYSLINNEELFIINLDSDLESCDKNNKDEEEINKIPFNYKFYNSKNHFNEEFNKLINYLKLNYLKEK